ncbi:hypothetical protein BGZ80_004384 [Entomortierella chlamydospora]|uniref:F-box domain-containing protein n=1 Tax=Entomortierella chlamydospora TaxID=101097 RepID=A0A9P6N1G1_9FUNG|nr:hypothetical protein BGZ79_006815 [Entomortierella chlamydospora]KAG0020332.1 hypothetical protein BGZ80_004384 [Entomortierella chlamydospora]
MSLFIFDIPHLVDGVAQYISTHDLTQCVLVSQQWFSWFTPTLWRTINTRNADNEQVQSALERHRGYVRYIVTCDTYKCFPSNTTIIPLFPNLRSLDYTSRGQSCDKANIWRYLSTERSLNKLKLRFDNVLQNNARILSGILASQPKLRQLDLTLNKSCDPMFIPKLFQACKNCHSLSLVLRGVKDPEIGNGEESEEAYRVVKDAMEQLDHMQLWELTIRLSSTFQWRAILAQLLRCCPQLERFALRDLCDIYTLQQVIKIFQDDTCPKLKHLCLKGVVWYEEEEDAADNVIRAFGFRQGCNRIGGGSDKTRASKSGLESYEALNLVRFTQQSARALGEFHADTLTALELKFSFSVQFPVFAEVMSCLPNLLVLKATIWLGSASGLSDIPDIETALQSTWLCSGLKTIQLCAMYKHQYYKARTSSLVDRGTAYLFEQIGRQLGLQEWTLESNVNLRCMKEGYLSKLTRLKRLRCFGLYVGLDFPLGEDEAEWMVLNWPRLVQVKCKFEDPWGDGFMSPRGLYNEFKLALQTRRPWIQID